MTVTGAARKQAGLYYDKGGTSFNVMHPDFGAKGDGTTDDSAAIQAALTAAAGLVPVVIPRTASYFKVGTSITVPSNSRLQIDGTVQMSTRLDAMFTATSQSNIHISGRGKLIGTGTHYAVLVSRLFYFIGCSDLSVIGPEISSSVWGAHFETCTDFDFDCRVKDISDTTDGTQGYGVLCSLTCERFRIAGRYNNIGRHAIYMSSGSRDWVIDDVVINGTGYSAISVLAAVTDNTIRNGVFGNVVIRNAGGTSSLASYGIAMAGNIDGIAISSGVVIDTTTNDGIFIQAGALETIQPQNIAIASPIIKNVTGGGIRVTNCSKVTMVHPRLSTISGTAITCGTSGTGAGSIMDDISIESYDINGAAVGIAVSGDALVTNVRIGFGGMRNVSGSKFNIASSNAGNTRYTGPSITLDFSELAIVPSQTNNAFVANPAAAFWVAPEAGYLTDLWGSLNAALTAGAWTVAAAPGASPSAILKVDMTGGVSPTAFSKTVPIGTVPVGAGGIIEVMYTSDAALAPSTRNVLAQLRFVPFPAA